MAFAQARRPSVANSRWLNETRWADGRADVPVAFSGGTDSTGCKGKSITAPGSPPGPLGQSGRLSPELSCRTRSGPGIVTNLIQPEPATTRETKHQQGHNPSQAKLADPAHHHETLVETSLEQPLM